MSAQTWHGTTNGYSNHECRCEECRSAWAAYNRDLRRVRRERLERGAAPADLKHGTKSTYDNWGCRCAPCRYEARPNRLTRRRGLPTTQ